MFSILTAYTLHLKEIPRAASERKKNERICTLLTFSWSDDAGYSTVRQFFFTRLLSSLTQLMCKSAAYYVNVRVRTMRVRFYIFSYLISFSFFSICLTAKLKYYISIFH